MSKPERLFHCTTPKKAKLYGESGRIISPVRGFDTLEAASMVYQDSQKCDH